MANAIKKISITQFENAVKENFPVVTTKQWFGIDITIKHTLSLTDILEFANDVVLSCFNDNGGFMPEVMDFAIRSNILTRYANFSLPDNLKKRYELIYNSDVVDFVCKHINMQQLQELTDAINRKIDYMCDTNVITIQKEMTKLLDAFESMQENTEKMFSGISTEDFSKLINTLTEHGSLDEKKIVDALMERKEETEVVSE